MNPQLINLVFVIFLSFLNCDSNQKKATQNSTVNTKSVKANNFNDYWFSGVAELNSYDLKQARYGEIRDGEVVLVFVTEPFSASKQVKLDNPKKTPEDDVTVMKLNNVRKFNTGIYDYSILTSTFTPINTQDYPNTLKATNSIQEWCGITFTQLNLEDNNYHYKQFSYFESQGDLERKIKVTLLEDEFFTRIRINNGELPIGEIELIPSIIQSRFTYQEVKPVKALIGKTATKNLIKYKIEIPSQKRTITIDVENQFPFKIMAWTEDNGDGLITTAKLKKSLKSPYWNQKSVADEKMRKELLLVK
ncbi:septum formation inhibitor Maf [Algibacter sp. L4_22]|uniref:septum formation inhibitor Maf n=1 Tax=Algibacter sp. L4_22 TaxID=2942477 RepID=UPI00201B632E|nr:septum formation inhibitor Maf [Algibacter sp. L4_22]MCL5128843.1 septum formation inhibitor Maf [Algibacter sp. L4_22]